MFNKAEIDVRNGNPVAKQFAFGKNFTVFGYQVVRRKYHIRRRFSAARVGVSVSADAFCRLHRTKASPVFRLADEFVARRKIDYYVRAVHGVPFRRRINRPKVLADFRGDFHRGVISVSENQFRSEGILFSVYRYNAVFVGRRSELPLLVKLVIRRQKGLRDNAEKFAVANRDRAVIEFSVSRERSADKQKSVVIH